MLTRMKKKEEPAVKVQSNLKNCVICGKIFLPVSTEDICKACYIRAKDKEQTVIDYVHEHQQDSLEEVAIACNVRQDFVVRMLAEGKFSDVHAGMAHPCKSCGETIFQGEYCVPCSQKIKSEIRNVTDGLRRKMAETAAAKSNRPSFHSYKD